MLWKKKAIQFDNTLEGDVIWINVSALFFCVTSLLDVGSLWEHVQLA